MKTWAIVASTARARIFAASGRHEPLAEIADLVNPEERLPRQELKSDKPARAFDKMGGHRHTTQTSVDPKEQIAMRFAKEVVEKLESDLHRKRFAALCVVAPPHFLGLLREQMSSAMARAVKGDLVKDLTREDAASIQGQVEHLL